MSRKVVEGIPPVQQISVDEALARILDLIHPVGSETVTLAEALDRVLAEDITSQDDIPPFVNSAMDGYAVRAADVTTACQQAPVELRVIGEVAAGGVPTDTVRAGTAVRIMTGAPMPPGADAVVPFEDTDQGRQSVRILRSVRVGDHVRQVGEDIRRGRVVLPAHHVLRPADIGVLASLGYPEVPVFRRPRVAVLATGDELVAVNEPLAPGKIRNSNEYTSIALVQRYGGLPLPPRFARASPAALISFSHRPAYRSATLTW